ncbi:restriction endonuclease subunit S [Azotobacter chroococcum]|uniref:restriction endonuclease subunit S n=1 Tax=Azotobacter chroococcum TaxID=353 RepID=UPI000B76F9BB|nr:restriction endonuclease subunit S [Azotobacter chroococcum]
MSGELPDNWITAKLDELAADINYGYTASSTQEEVGPRLLRITDIQENKVSWETVPYCEIGEAQKEKYLLKDRDLVFARTGATVGKSFLIKGEIPESVFASYLIRVRCLQKEISDYLVHFFKSPAYWGQITEFSAGIGQPNVNGSKLKELSIPLPPLAEQTRIAAKLDELLAQVDTLKARIDGIPALLKRFRQSVLAAAVSGRLTEEWREKNTRCLDVVVSPKANKLSMEELAAAEEILGEPLPAFWKKYALEQLVEPGRGVPYGIVQTGAAVEKGIPTVRCGDVKNLFIDTSNLKTVSAEVEQEYKRTRLKGGEVLLAIRGSVGNVGVAPESLRDCNISREVAMIPTLPAVVPFYLACILQSPLGQRLLVGKVRGVAQKGINLADVRRLPVALPTFEEQTEIVRRVEQLFAFADQLEAKVNEAKTRIDRLTQSILAKAFRGELVPQNPDDEAASVLLERIQAQRAAAPKAKRKRRVGAD